MSVDIFYMRATEVRVSVATKGEEFGDGQILRHEVGLCLDDQAEPVIITGGREEVKRMLNTALRKVDPHRHADLERQVLRARKAAEYGSNDVEIERLREALDVALTLLRRNDLR